MDRRGLLKASAYAAGSTALATPLMGLFTRQASAEGPVQQIKSPYGPIRPVRDESTRLPLLQLPKGFSYQSFGWTGDLMNNGRPTPTRHDGMAVVKAEMVGGETEITLIRNHESFSDDGIGLISDTVNYDAADIVTEETDGVLTGGTTQLVYRGGQWVGSEPSLGGTIVNCAGGPTPWNSWLTCEESAEDLTEFGGLKHGYVFETAADTSLTTGQPIIGMGRFRHEAVALDPETGIVYLTEDDRNQAGLYRYLPIDTSGEVNALGRGGQLQMAKIAGEPRFDLLTPMIGDSYAIEWVSIEDPDLDPQPFTEAPFEADNLASGPFAQGRDLGGARFSRLEGCWYSAADQQIYIVDTSAGLDEEGMIGRGEGAVWAFDPAVDTLTCIFVSDNPVAGNNPDNITVSPRGGILLCEDGGGVEDDFGFGERLLGLTQEGETFIFAKNNIELDSTAIRGAGKSQDFIEPGDFRETEWAGATFDPEGQVLFVNIQTPGITFAIKGPWQDGIF